MYRKQHRTLQFKTKIHTLYGGIVSDVYLVYTNTQQGDDVYRKERLQSNLDNAGDCSLSPKHLTSKLWHEHEVGELSLSFPCAVHNVEISVLIVVLVLEDMPIPN